MHATFLLALLSLSIPHTLHASPVQAPSPSQCGGPVGLVVSALKLYSAATPFCSSYIKIPTITSTNTVTSATTVSVTTTGTAIVTGAASTTIVTSTVTTCTDPYVIYKRAVATTTKPSASIATPLPPAIQSFATTQISSACSCLGIPTPTTTVTTTAKPIITNIATITAIVTTTLVSTSTVIATTVTSCPQCDNAGLEYAFDPNRSGYNPGDGYSNFNPAEYKNVAPTFTDVTPVLGFDYPQNGVQDIYGHRIGNGQAIPYDYFVINHRGYIVPPETGRYEFQFPTGADDFLEIWIGDVAKSGWQTSNGYRAPFGLDFEKGKYYPIRIVYANAQGGGYFQLDITDPHNDLMVTGGPGRTSATNPGFLRRYSCDGTTAPRYPPFGAET